MDAPADTNTATTYTEQILGNPWVQQALTHYDTTKHSCSLMENTLGKDVAFASGQLVYDKANNAYDVCYVKPVEKIGNAYNTGKQKTKVAYDTSKDVVIKTATVGIGATVVATQLSLAFSAGGVTMLIDTLAAGKDAGQRILVSVKEIENALEQRVWNAITETQRLAMIPVDKCAESANSVLDIAFAMVERFLNITIQTGDTDSVTQRVKALAQGMAAALTTKAHTEVIDPLNNQMNVILEHLSKSLVIVDLVRSKREWALEKAEELSSSVSDLKARFEQEALAYRTKPEAILMTSIRASATQLSEKLVVLKQKGNEFLGDGNTIETAISYLEDLEKSLASAGDIYAVRDEVLSEARQRLAELTHWTAALFTKKDN